MQVKQQKNMIFFSMSCMTSLVDIIIIFLFCFNIQIPFDRFNWKSSTECFHERIATITFIDKAFLLIANVKLQVLKLTNLWPNSFRSYMVHITKVQCVFLFSLVVCKHKHILLRIKSHFKLNTIAKKKTNFSLLGTI